MELTPNRDLINPNFGGYKLVLDRPPSWETSLEQKVRSLSASEEQYSFLHAKAFGHSNNLLVQDGCDPDVVFLLHPQENAIYRLASYLEEGKASSQRAFEFATHCDAENGPRQGDYNPSLVTAGPQHAVASDGKGVLYILNTGPRKAEEGDSWISLFHDQVLGSDQAFVVVDARLSSSDEVKTSIDVLLQYVAERKKLDENASPESSDYCTALEWLTFSCRAGSGATWSVERARRFMFLGSLDFVALDKSATLLTACTEKPYKLIYDSEGLAESPAEDSAAIDRAGEPATEKRRPKFYFKQDCEEVVVWIRLAEGVTKRDLKVSLKPRELSVVIRGEPVISGELHHVVQRDSLAWTIEKGRLEILASKASEGRIWTSFFASKELEQASGAEEVHSQQEMNDIENGFDEAKREASEQEPTANLFNAEQLEECDAMPEDQWALHVFNGQGNTKGSTVNLAGSKWLFNSRDADGERVMCLRHDVDGLIWSPRPEAVAHVSTLPAMGYVQASKSLRKFSVSAPNCSYTAICDRTRHVYLYRQPEAIAKECDLRNRKSGQRVTEVAHQQVITLEGDAGAEEVMGAVATNRFLLILTEARLLSVRVNV